MEFKDKLKAKRKNRRLTQAQLAERGGFHDAAISHFETGSREPGLKNIIRLCQGLKCKPNDLIDT